MEAAYDSFSRLLDPRSAWVATALASKGTRAGTLFAVIAGS